MKKIILIITTLLLITTNLFATFNNATALSRGFAIEGGVGKYNQINIFPIQATSGSEDGFPFDIKADNVVYTDIVGGGRKIATWSVATNYSNVQIEITATPLTYEASSSFQLNYYLVFHIMYATYKSDGSFEKNEHTDFKVLSDGNTYKFSINNAILDEPFPVVSYNQDVRFYFVNGIRPKEVGYPYGLYSGTVTISVSGD